MIRARVIAEPANEPLSIVDCYQQLRIFDIDSDGRPDDDLILAYARAAREHCENFTGLSLALKDYEVEFTSFPDPLELPHPPFVALINDIVVGDGSDNAIDAADYRVDDYSGMFTTISPVSSWPSVDDGDTVRIRYRAGYGDESDAYGPVPAPIRAAMLLLLGHLYANREATTAQAMMNLPLGVEALLRPYRVNLGFA